MADKVLDTIGQVMYREDGLKQIIIVYHGQYNSNYSHAASFIRGPPFKQDPLQLTLLDCANEEKYVFPRMYKDQDVIFKDKVRVKEDILGDYHAWQLFYIDVRRYENLNDYEMIINRMNYNLTGKREYLNEMLRLNAQKGNAGRRTKAVMRKSGQATYVSSKRRHRRNLFHKRPNKSMTEKRRAKSLVDFSTQMQEGEEIVISMKKRPESCISKDKSGSGKVNLNVKISKVKMMDSDSSDYESSSSSSIKEVSDDDVEMHGDSDDHSDDNDEGKD